ncbi:MAG: V-type ATPase subunit [Methanosarcinales archaeon]|nr:MAG: V-type ATPase subunit [Methanosarcinales archaeon]
MLGDLLNLLNQFDKLLGVALIEWLYVMALGVFAVVIVKIIAPKAQILVNAMRFAYPNARVRAVGVPYVLATNMHPLLESKNVSEVISRIADSYKLDVTGDDPDEIEKALKLALFRTYKNTIARVPECIKPFLESYLTKFEAEQLKVAIKGKNAGLSPDAIKKKTVSVGNITPDLIGELAEADSMDRIVQILSDTAYGKTLSNALLDYEKTGSMLPLELALDGCVFQGLSESASKIPASVVASISKFVDTYVDVTNIKVVIRGKKEGFEPETTRKYLLPGGTLPAWMLIQVAESRDVAEIVSTLEKTKYVPLLKKAMSEYEKSGSIYAFEAIFDRHLLHMVFGFARENTFDVGPIMRFIIAKDYEVRNIRAALHGIRESMSLEKMKDIVICEEGI